MASRVAGRVLTPLHMKTSIISLIITSVVLFICVGFLFIQVRSLSAIAMDSLDTVEDQTEQIRYLNRVIWCLRDQFPDEYIQCNQDVLADLMRQHWDTIRIEDIHNP